MSRFHANGAAITMPFVVAHRVESAGAAKWTVVRGNDYFVLERRARLLSTTYRIRVTACNNSIAIHETDSKAEAMREFESLIDPRRHSASTSSSSSSSSTASVSSALDSFWAEAVSSSDNDSIDNVATLVCGDVRAASISLSFFLSH